MDDGRAGMRHAFWIVLPLLACAPQDTEQRDLRAQTVNLPSRQITLTCAQGPRTVAILGNGAFVRSGRLIYVCTEPLAGGLACTAGQMRHVIDFEERRAIFARDNASTQECTF